MVERIMLRGGIDLGGTHLAAGILSEDGKLIGVAERPTRAGRPVREIVSDLADALREASKKAGVQPDALDTVGVDVPGAADDEAGTVTNCNNLGWYHVPLREELARLIRVPIHLGNDANAAALAECRYGAARGAQSCVMITLGTGVGAGIVLNGKIWSGAFGYAGEIGHMPLVPAGIPCTCGRVGCMEQYCSATALIRMGRRQCALFRDTRMLTCVEGNPDRLTAKIIMDCAKEGDSRALAAFREYTGFLASALDGIMMLLEPEVIVLGGGVSRAGDFLLEALQALLPRYESSEKRPEIPLRQAMLGNEAGLIGAALLGEK